MADKINISVGLTADIQEFLSNLQKQFGNLKSLGLDKAAEKDVSNIMGMLKDLSKSISDLGGSKVNTSSFARAQKEILEKIQTLETRTSALEKNMTSLVSTMSQADGGKFANQMKEIAQTMDAVSEATRNTVSAISDFSSNAGSRINSLEANLKDLEGILDIANSDFNIDIKFNSFKEARDHLIGIYNQIQDLKKDASSIVPETDDDVKRLASVQTEIVKLIRSFEEIYDQQFDGQFSKQFEEFTTTKGLTFDDLEENLDKTMGRILDNVKYTIEVVKRERDSISDVDIATDIPAIESGKRGLTVPMDISTKDSTLLKRAIEIVNTVNSGLENKPVEAKVVLTTAWGTRKSNELLKQFQSQIDNLSQETDVTELRKLAESISASFGDEINLKFKSNFDDEIKGIGKGISELKKQIGKNFVVNPKLKIADEELAEFKTQIDSITDSLRVTVEKSSVDVGADILDSDSLEKDTESLREIKEYLFDIARFGLDTKQALVPMHNMLYEVNNVLKNNPLSEIKNSAIELLNIIKQSLGFISQESEKKIISKKVEENSFSQKDSEKLGNDLGKKYAKGIEDKVESVRKAAKKLADAATEELEKASNITVKVKTEKAKSNVKSSATDDDGAFTEDDIALQDAYKQADAYQKREAEYISLRNQYIKEGQKQAQEVARQAEQEAKARQKQAEAEAKAQKKYAEDYEKWWIKALDAKEKEAERAAKAEEKNAQKIVDMQKRLTKATSIENYLKTNQGLSSERRNMLQDFISELRNGDLEMLPERLADIDLQFKNIKGDAKAAGEAGATFGQKLQKSFGNLTRYLLTFASFYKIVGAFKQAFNTVYELDTALVDLRKTTTMTAEELNKFYFDANNVAKQMGVTTAEIINQASAWSRLGYSSKEAATEMAALSSQFAQISPGMSVENATDGLVSTMKAFHIDVANVEREVMDNVNIIGNRMATTNEEVIEMLKRSSAAMNAANNSLQQTIALESAAVQITRNAETTGTAFRTISMRIRGLDEETEEAMEDFDMLQGKIADLTKTAKTPGGISLFTDESKTQYKSTYELLKDIAEIYHDLTDKEQAGLLEALAGKRGGQVLAGILDDFSEVERAMNEMEGAAGSADKEMGIIEESWQYKLNNLKQTWVGFFQDLIDRGVIADLIDGLTRLSESLIKIIDINPKGFLALTTGLIAFLKFNSRNRDTGGILDVFNEMAKLARSGNIGTSLGDIVSKFVSVKDAASSAAEVIPEFEVGFGVMEEGAGAVETLTGGMGALTTATKGSTLALTGLGTAFAWVAGAAIVIGGLAVAWDAFTTTVEETEKAISDTETKISSIKTELDELRSISARTDEQENRIELLQTELDIQEKLLDIEKKRRLEEQTGTKFSDQFDKDNWNTILDRYDARTMSANENGASTGDTYFQASLKEDIELYKQYQQQVNETAREIERTKDKIDNPDRFSAEEIKLAEKEYEKLVRENAEYQEMLSKTEKLILDNSDNAYEEYASLYSTYQDILSSLESMDEDDALYSKTKSIADSYESRLNDLKKVIDDSAKFLGTYDFTKTREDFSEMLAGFLSLTPNKKDIMRNQYLDFFNELSDEDFKIITDADIDWDKINPDLWLSRMQALIDSHQPLKLRTEIDNPNLNQATFSTQVNELDALLSSYENFRKNVESNEPKINLDISEVDALREKFGQIEGFDFDQFEITVTSDTSGIDDIQKAFNEALTAYANTEIELEGINEENKDMIRTQLEMEGATAESAQAFVDSAMRVAEVKQAIANSSIDMNNATEADIQKLIEENDELDLSQAELLEYMILHGNADSSVWNIDLSALIEEYEQLGFNCDALREYNSLKGNNLASKAYGDGSGKTGFTSYQDFQYGQALLNDKKNAARDEVKKNSLDQLVYGPSSSSARSTGGGAGKEAGDAYVDAFNKELEKLKDAYERGDISLKDYLAQWKALIQKFFADNPKYAEEYANQMKAYLDSVKGYFDGAISGVTTIIQGRISAVEKQKDKAIKAIEAERDAAIKGLEDQKKAIQAQIKAKQKQIKELEKAKKPLQDEIDAIQKANEERERELELQKNLYELQRAMNQRTQLVKYMPTFAVMR